MTEGYNGPILVYRVVVGAGAGARVIADWLLEPVAFWRYSDAVIVSSPPAGVGYGNVVPFHRIVTLWRTDSVTAVNIGHVEARRKVGEWQLNGQVDNGPVWLEWRPIPLYRIGA